MPNTGLPKFPYPNGSDIPDGPAAFLALGQRMALMAGAGVVYAATAAARTALVTNTDAFEGMLVHQVDTHTLWEYRGSTWVARLEDTGWITADLRSGWSATAGTVPRYKRLNGVVYLEGRATGGSGAILILPAGFRPDQNVRFAVSTSAAFDTMLIAPNGEVTTSGNTYMTANFPADA